MKQSVISGVVVFWLIGSYLLLSGLLNGASLSAFALPLALIALPFGLSAFATSLLAIALARFIPKPVAVTLSGVCCGIALGAFMFFANPFTTPPQERAEGLLAYAVFGLSFAAIDWAVARAWPNKPLQPIARENARSG